MVELGCEWNWRIGAGDELFPSPNAVFLGQHFLKGWAYSRKREPEFEEEKRDIASKC